MRISDYFEKAVAGPHRPFAMIERHRVTFGQALEAVHAIANAMDDDAAIPLRWKTRCPAQIQPTGGGTGPSKGAVYTHRRQVMNFINGKVTSDPKLEHTYLAVAPLAHAGGAVAMNALCSGNTVVLLADTCRPTPSRRSTAGK